MRAENFISVRYLTAKKGRFLAFLNFVSIAGVAVGVMALIVVIGIMTGFGNNLRDKIIGTTPHISIEKETGVKGYADTLLKIKEQKNVIGASPYIHGSIFLERSGRAQALALRGIEPASEAGVTKIQDYITEGSFDQLTERGVIIGSELARYNGYNVGDLITLIAPGSGLSGQGWRYELKVAGIFSSGMVDFDTNLILVNLKKAQEIYGATADYATGIGVKLKDPYMAKEFKESMYGTLGYSFLIRTWIDVNRNLFDALWLEKWGLFLILVLMVLVAAFNIISTLIVTVTSKVHDIGILQSIGLTRSAIRRIFTKLGMFIGSVGTFWGVVLGLSVSYILRTYVKVPQELYSIDRVPVEIQLSDMLIIVGATLLITFFATIYPAMRAAELQPVDALRYE